MITTQQRSYVIGTGDNARLDIDGMTQALFEDPVVAAKIIQDYSLDSDAPLSKQVSNSFGQVVEKPHYSFEWRRCGL